MFPIIFVEMVPYAVRRVSTYATKFAPTSVSIFSGSFTQPPANEMDRTRINIREMLGEGFFGAVSRAYYLSDSGQVTVAVKSLSVTGLTSNSTVNRASLLQEASIMSILDHPNIVKIIGIVSIGDPVLVVLELCEKGELGKYLASNELSIVILLQFCRDCAEGMKYLTSKRIVHRDLAARNVLVTSAKQCKISDYGLSRATLDKLYYRSTGVALPVLWTAPEALERQVFSEQTDVWSFGILLHEIWSMGAEPYAGMTTFQAWAKIVGGYRLPCPPDCPESVFIIMRDCWIESGTRPVFAAIADRLSKINPNKLSQIVYTLVDKVVVPIESLVVMPATSQTPSTGVPHVLL